MARRGWGGFPPGDDDEARGRIVEAAIRCIDRSGPEQTTLSDVAAELSVIRQTVYRYFPSTDHLFAAVGRVAVATFIDELTVDLWWRTDPADWVVEAVALAIERLPNERYLTLLQAAGRTESFARGMTSKAGVRMSRTLLERSQVDWAGAGFDDDELDGLVELMLRLLQSIVLNPPAVGRDGDELRRFLRRWVAPSVVPAAVTS